ncbi:MAG TPA: hypothetical protein VEH04_11525 [Verrucomicrobiae bacterium]|nr:hypothetical protein [Verrucomicrobiae bacterium]
MKKLTLLSTLVGALLLAGCTTYRGGSEADFESEWSAEQDNLNRSAMDADVGVGWGARLDRRPGPVVPPP